MHAKIERIDHICIYTNQKQSKSEYILLLHVQQLNVGSFGSTTDKNLAIAMQTTKMTKNISYYLTHAQTISSLHPCPLKHVSWRTYNIQ